jgi:hypothetical protein
MEAPDVFPLLEHQHCARLEAVSYMECRKERHFLRG